MTTVHVELPERVFSTLHRSPGEVALEMKLAAAIDWYRRGLLSQGRAAEIAGLARAAFLDELAARKIDVFHVDIDELKEEINRA